MRALLIVLVMVVTLSAPAGAQTIVSAPDLPRGYEAWSHKTFSCALPNGSVFTAGMYMRSAGAGRVDYVLVYGEHEKPFIVWNEAGLHRGGDSREVYAYFLRMDGRWLKRQHKALDDQLANARASDLTSQAFLGMDTEDVDAICRDGGMFSAMGSFYTSEFDRIEGRR